nr:FecR family protein [uncultured Prevotella sp.]
MNNEEKLHTEDYTREEVSVRDYFLRVAHPAPNVQDELKAFMQQQTESLPVDDESQDEVKTPDLYMEEEENHRIPLRGIGIALAIAASLALVFILHFGKQKPSLDVPEGAVVAYEADADGQADGVTLQSGDAEPISISASQKACAKINASALAGGASESQGTTIVRNVLTTPSNATAEVVLADGSVVTVNAGSRLIYPQKFAGETREVELQGEAYFKVKHDERYPFIVKANGISTKVLGTEFNVRSYSKNDTHVTLLQGSVLVSLLPSHTSSAKTSLSKRLKPGEDAAFQGGSLSVNSVDTEIYTAWKNGEFYFDNESLLDIAKEIGKWYNVSVIFRSPEKMHARLFFAAPRDGGIEELLELLNGLDKAKFSYKDGQVIIE